MFAFKLAQENGLILPDLPDFKDVGEARRYVQENGEAFEGMKELLVISIRKRFTISSETKTIVKAMKLVVKKPAKKKGEKD